MTAEMLLDTLHRSGVVLTLVDGRLHVAAPPGAVTHELRAAMLERRSELLQILADDPVARRVSAFRAQVQAAGNGPIQFLRLPDAMRCPGPGRCLSCGDPATDRYGTRCTLCATAAWEAVDRAMPPPGPEPRRVEGSTAYTAEERTDRGWGGATGPVPWLHTDEEARVDARG